jgi:predicted RNase H-like HicB family nuclease
MATPTWAVLNGEARLDPRRRSIEDALDNLRDALAAVLAIYRETGRPFSARLEA